MAFVTMQVDRPLNLLEQLLRHVALHGPNVKNRETSSP